MPRITRRFTVLDGRRNASARFQARRFAQARALGGVAAPVYAQPSASASRREHASVALWRRQRILDAGVWTKRLASRPVRVPFAESRLRDTIRCAPLVPSVQPGFETLATRWSRAQGRNVPAAVLVHPWSKTLYRPVREVVERAGAEFEVTRFEPFWVPGCFQREALDELFGRDVLASADRLPTWHDALDAEFADRERRASWERSDTGAGSEDVLSRQREERAERERLLAERRAARVAGAVLSRQVAPEQAAREVRQRWLRSRRGRGWQAAAERREAAVRLALVREIVAQGGDPRAEETAAWVQGWCRLLGRERGYRTCLAKLRARAEAAAVAA